MKFTRRQLVGITLCIVLSFIAAYILVLTPKYLGSAVDLMVGKGNVDLSGVRKILLFSLGLYSAYFMLTWFVSWFANQIAVRFVKNIRSQLEYRLNRNPLSFLDTHPHGNLLSHFSIDGELLIDGLFQLISQLFSGVFVVLISLYFMLQVNVRMTLMVIAMVPVMYLTSSAIAKRSLVLYRRQQSLAGQLGGHVQEAMNNHQLILSSNYQKESVKDFEAIHAEYNEVGEKAQFLGALVNPTVRVINNISYVLIGLMGAYVSKNYGLTVGTLTSFISYSIIFSKPFNEFSAIVAQVMSAKASYDRILETLAYPIEEDRGEKMTLKGEVVSFEHVDFSYVKGHPIIQDLSLEIPPLSKVAIVGPTGAGKSTLINILMRFYDVDSGIIKIDGVDTSTLTKESLGNVMSIVLQDPWLFEGTIRQNIKYGKPHATDAEMIEVSIQAGCHDYIQSLDKGYDTKIDLGSQNISLGQKQMITIARALMVDAPILILDEATSNVDVLTEYKIQEVFRKIMAQRTSFFVAHRLATVVDSDVILVMREGKLVEQGTHKELMALKGFYHTLFMSQFDSV